MAWARSTPLVSMLWLLISVLLAPAALAAPSLYPLQAHAQPFGAPVDQSDLNHPLGSADSLFVRQGHFYAVGPDGLPNTGDDQRVRLYGASLSYAANFPDAQQARRMARRLRSLGFNAVRLHHMDAIPGGDPSQPSSLLLPGAYPNFNPVAIDRLKTFIGTLKEEGIYTDLNLHVDYPFNPQTDQVPGLAPINGTMPSSAPVQIFYPRLIQLQVAFAQELIKRLNLGKDPALAVVELRNESSLAGAWQDWDLTAWNAATQGVYGDELTRQWNDWLARKYGSVTNACAHWQPCEGVTVQPLVSPEEADSQRSGVGRGVWRRLMDHWRALESRLREWLGLAPVSEFIGPAEQRFADFAEFIADLDRHYFGVLKQAVREVARPGLPITGTQQAFGGELNRLSQRDMDYLDEHTYVDHYTFPGHPWDNRDWRIKDASLTRDAMDTMTRLACSRDPDSPFVVSEFNQPFPNRQGAEIGPVMALLAALQDWDGLFPFDYASSENPEGFLPSAFDLVGDWPKLAISGQVARLFRAPLLPPLTPALIQRFDPQQALLRAGLRKREGRGLAWGSAIPWTPEQLFRYRLGVSPNATATPKAAPSDMAASSAYDAQQGRLVIDSPALAAVVGRFSPGERVAVGRLAFEPTDAQRGFITVLVSAIDGSSLAQSRRLLVSLPGYVMGSQPGILPPRPQQLVPYPGGEGGWTLEPDASAPGKPSGSWSAQGPVWMERVPLTLGLQGDAEQVQVYPLDLMGRRMAALPALAIEKRSGGIAIHLQQEASPQSPWYELVIGQDPGH